MEKHILTVSYWLGLLSTLITFGLRAASSFGTSTPGGVKQGLTFSYNSFYKGALLFLVIAIATAGYTVVRGQKTS